MAPTFLASPQVKRAYNRFLFRIVAPKYAAATRGLSLLRDAAWKRLAVSLIPNDIPGGAMLDVASGSGDCAALLAKRFGPRPCVAADLSFAMSRIAAQRLDGRALVTLQDMCRLGLRDCSAAVACGGYALRNAPDLPAALAEVFRVVKPGGAAVFLEFSRSRLPLAAAVQLLVLKTWGELWGLLLHGRPFVYRYIADSLATYPDKPALHALCRRAGFTVAKSKMRMFGLIEILLLRKPTHSSLRPSRLCGGSSSSIDGNKEAAAPLPPRIPWLPDLSARIYEQELLDAPGVSDEAMAATLDNFRLINRLLSPFRRDFNRIIVSDIMDRRLTRVSICDFGAGAGDHLQWCVAVLKRRGIDCTAVYLDADRRTARFLRRRTGGEGRSLVVCADAAAGCIKQGSIDYALSNHMLHHLDERQALGAIAAMRGAARFGFLITDLVRSLPSYIGFRLAATVFFRSGFTLYDGLLSIRRAFTIAELGALMAKAGLAESVRVRAAMPGHFRMWGG